MYHTEMLNTLRKRSNIWRFRGGEGCSSRQAVICGRGLAKSLYNFYIGWESLIHSSSCSIYGMVYVEEGIGWKRQNIVIWGRGSKIAQKTVMWYFERFLKPVIILTLPKMEKILIHIILLVYF